MFSDRNAQTSANNQNNQQSKSVSKLIQAYGHDDKQGKLDPDDHIKWLIANINYKHNILQRLITQLKVYAQESLNQVGTKNNYTIEPVTIGDSNSIAAKKESTHADRVVATNLLFDIAKSSCVDDIYQYVMTPAFKKLAGITGNINFNFTKLHLSDVINEFVQDYEYFQNESSPQKMVAMLLHKDFNPNTHQNELGHLFVYYYPELIAQYIVTVAKLNKFNANLREINVPLTFSVLSSFLHNVVGQILQEKINLARHKYSLSFTMSENTCMPGVNPLEDEGLSLNELFQYDETTIYAVEQILREKFFPVLANVYTQYDCMSEKNSPYYFYLIPSASYMLVNPTNKTDKDYFRYLDFKIYIRDLTKQVAQNESFEKPVILCGIVNLEGTHYVTYFVYAEENKAAQVLIIDSSPFVNPEESNEKDGRMKARLKLDNIFNDIFDNIEISHSSSAQMLRERDCGPCSATTLWDAFATCTQEESLISIQNGHLVLNEEMLSIAAKPIAVNPYTGTYVYSSGLRELASKNRKAWEDQLRMIHEVKPVTIRKSKHNGEPWSIYDEYDMNDQFAIDYNYDKAVYSQNQHDVRGVNVSTVYSILQSYDEGRQIINNIVTQYKKDLIVPSIDELANYIKSKITASEIDNLTLAHGHSLSDLTKDVIGIILADYIPASLENVFKVKVLDLLPNAIDLNAERIVEDYLNENSAIFNRITIHHQRTLKLKLNILASDAIHKKMLIAHENFLRVNLNKNFRYYLGSVGWDVAERDLHKTIKIIMSESSKEVAASVQFVQSSAHNSLNKIITDHISIVIGNIKYKSANYLISKMYSEDKMTIEYLLQLIDRNGSFSKLERNDFNAICGQYLLDTIRSQPDLVTSHEINGYLGRVVLNELNNKLFDYIDISLNQLAKEKTQLFLQIPAVKSLITSSMPLPHLHYHLHVGCDSCFKEENLASWVDKYGSQDTITLTIFNHPALKKFIISEMHKNINEVLRLTLHDVYSNWAYYICLSNKNNFSYSVAKQYILSGKDESTLAVNLITKYLNSEDGTLIHSDSFRRAILNPIYAAYTPLGNDFISWLANSIKNTFVYHYQSCETLLNNTEITLAIFAKVKSHLYKDEADSIELISNLEGKLNELKKAIIEFDLDLSSNYIPNTVYHPKESVNIRFQKVYNRFLYITHYFCQMLYDKHYKVGDLMPGSLSVILRPYFCQLLNVPVDVALLSEEQAARVDEIINRNMALVPPLYPMSKTTKLLVLEKVDELPSTYAVDLTLKLLLDCIFYWNSHADVAYKISHPSRWLSPTPKLISAMIDLVNKYIYMPSNSFDKDRVAQELGRIISSHHHARENIFYSNDILQKIIAVLLRTKQFRNENETRLSFAEITTFLNVADKTNKRATKRLDATVTNNKLSISSEVVNVHTGKLKRSSVQQFFGTHLTQIEKKLMTIQDKHGGYGDFYLDDSDIKLLCNTLEIRWKKLISDSGYDSAIACYCDASPSRADAVYIAMSEILALHFRHKGFNILCHELLMPDNKRFLPANKLVQLELPEKIAEAYDEDDNHISIIELEYLLTLPTGYAINILWVEVDYVQNTKLENPYTGVKYNDDELNAICSHPKADKLLNKVMQNCIINEGMTKAAIGILRNYLNAAIFDDGFSRDYTDEQNRRAFDAFTTFNVNILKLTASERNALLEETIPGETSDTVRSSFAVSEIRGQGRCLTQKGIAFAKVVIAYEGDNHGLKSSMLVRSAKMYDIHKRVYPAETVICDMSDQEKYIMNWLEDRPSVQAKLAVKRRHRM